MNATLPLARRLRGLQDGLFESLAEWLMGREGLARAAEFDDRESRLERVAFARLQRCPDCCRHALPLLLTADALDHQERREGYEPTLVRFDAGATFLRGVSTEVEAMRAAVVPVSTGRRKVIPAAYALPGGETGGTGS